MGKEKMLTAIKAAEVCKGKLLSGKPDTILYSFAIDTREIKKGEMYVGIRSDKNYGALFWEEAIENGALGVLVEDFEIPEEKIQKYKDKVIIMVQDTTKALQELAIYKRSLYDIPVIAVTGSVGKTSTKDMIASVLKEKFNVHKTYGNFNNQIGLPLTILGLREEHTAMVTEMGMNHFGEISLLTNIAKPTMAVITNIGTAHIGNLGSRENILKAKLEILEGLDKEGIVVINNDNDLLNKWAKEQSQYTIETYGIENKSKYNAENIVLNQDGSTYNINIGDKEYNVYVPVGGNHFVYNSLCAICVGTYFGIPMEKILKGIKELELTKRRMEIIKNDNFTVINDCYNASYDSMKPAIEYLSKLTGNKKIAVLGDMLELGEYSKELHEKVGEEIYKNNINILIVVGELSKDISKKAKALGMKEDKIFECNNTQDAADKLNSIIEKDDVILLKASNAMRFNEILEKINN